MDRMESYCKATQSAEVPGEYLFNEPTISSLDRASNCPCSSQDTYCQCPDAGARTEEEKHGEDTNWKEIAAAVAMLVLMALPFFMSGKKGPPDGPGGSGSGKRKIELNGGNMPPSKPTFLDVFSIMETEPAPLYGFLVGGIGLLQTERSYSEPSIDGIWKWVALGALVAANVISIAFFRKKNTAAVETPTPPPQQPAPQAKASVDGKRGPDDLNDPPPGVTVSGLMSTGEGSARPIGTSRIIMQHPIRAFVLGSRTVFGQPLAARQGLFRTAVTPFLTLRFR